MLLRWNFCWGEYRGGKCIQRIIFLFFYIISFLLLFFLTSLRHKSKISITIPTGEFLLRVAAQNEIGMSTFCDAIRLTSRTSTFLLIFLLYPYIFLHSCQGILLFKIDVLKITRLQHRHTLIVMMMRTKMLK